MKNILILLSLLPFLISCDSDNLSVLTYNIRLSVDSDADNAWLYRRDFLIDQIRFYEPDIFGIQEGLPEQVKYMNEKLDKYEYLGIGRDEKNTGEHTAVFYKKDRFDILEESTFWLSETPDSVSIGWDAACRRICTYAHFLDKVSKQKLWFFNTHLDHKGIIARIESVKLIFQKVENLPTLDEPVILTGDFNDTPNSELIKLTEQQFVKCEDLSEEPSFGPCGTFNGFNFCDPVTEKIDFIFLKKPVKCRVLRHAVLSDSRDCKYPSDHLPVYAEFQLK